jgi:hypothetical protein
MANPTFTEALSSMRRRAQLSGRPLSKQEMSGAVAGMAETASQRLYRGRSVQLEEKRIGIEEERLDLAQQSDERQYDIAKKRTKQDERRDTTTGVLGGAVAGAYIAKGAALGSVGGIPGAALGGALGAIVGFIASKCLIISACSGPDSYEVEISRMYRDNHMSQFELIGYYTIAPPIAALIHRHRPIKRFVKSQLVDRMVDYAEWLFRIKPEMKNPVLSKFVTKTFLSLCRTVGKYQFNNRGVVYDGQ